MDVNVTTKKYCYPFLLAMLFVISFFAVRVPLLREPFGLEEGIFAELIVNRPSGPQYALAGRIDGEKIYEYISHPAAPYELLRLGGYLSQKILTYNVYLDDSSITPRLRLICSLYQFIFWGTLLLLVFFKRKLYGKWPILLIFAVMLSPLSIKTSVHLQIDNTSGVILCGAAALLFTMAGQINVSDQKKLLLLFAGGFIAGLGKQEWSFALLIATIVTVLLGLFKKSNADRKLSTLKFIALGVVGGLIAGNLASYSYDSTNYTKGFHILYRHVNIYEDSSPGWALVSWLALMKNRLPFVTICLMLLFVIFLSLFTNKKRNFLYHLVLFYGVFLFVGYILSDWHSQPRYYCPSLAVLAVSAITMTSHPLPRWYRRTLFWGSLLVFFSTVVFTIGYAPDRNLDLEYINSGQVKSSSGTVLYIRSGAGWNKPEIDYMNNNTPYELRKENVKEKFGKRLIKPTLQN